MVQCPTCEKSLETERGMKSHHSQVHDENIGNGRKTVTLTCEHCGEEYEKRKDRSDESRFCSGFCQRKGRETRGRDLEKRSCEICGEKFETHVNNEQRFCSHDCHYKWLHDYLTGENSPHYSRIDVTCSECGEVFSRSPSKLEGVTDYYCSRECYYKNHSGEHAPRWKGGSSNYYGKTWGKQRKKALNRDGHHCQNCGITQEKHQSRYKRELEVHHIKPFRTFEDTKKAHKLENLVTLCTSCHPKIEAEKS